MRSNILAAAAAVWAMAGAAAAQTPCGGNFSSFVNDMKAEAVASGHDRGTVDAFFSSVRHDQSVVNADRRQGIFRSEFIDFARRLISQNRMDNGRRNLQRHADLFERARRDYGVSPGVLTAFWAFETDFGGFQGDFNTANALVTLAHDCRRPEIFRPQVFAAIELFERGMFDPATTTGAWAGEIGQVQMLPADILTSGIDGDGDGRVDLKRSVPDAILSGANLLRNLGWRAGEPWLHEVAVPETLDWSLTGLRTQLSVAEWQRLGVAPRHGSLPAANMPASIIVPQGRYGPAFMVFPNFSVLFEWNESFIYVVTTAYFATRLEGAPVFAAGNPEPGLGQDAMRELQRRLVARGYDVGGVDGILGAKTRESVQAVQQELGMPADAWPTPALLNRL